MGTHWMIFLTIGNLISPRGASGPPLQTKDLSGLGFQREPGRHQSRLTTIG
jgi:hypothetical protein